MRERITFIHRASDTFDPEQFQVKNNSLQVQSLETAREDQWSIGFSDLPQEARLLVRCRLAWLTSCLDMASIEALP